MNCHKLPAIFEGDDLTRFARFSIFFRFDLNSFDLKKNRFLNFLFKFEFWRANLKGHFFDANLIWI